jgi:hypothetical protein
MKKRLLITFSLMMFLVSAMFAQEVSVYSKLDTNSILIGDQVKMSIGISMPVSTKVNWPIIPDTILGYIKVLGRSKLDTAFSADKHSVTLNQSFLMTTFDSGFYSIPQIRFSTHTTTDTTATYYMTAPLFLSVHTMNVDTTQAMKPIKGPIRVPIGFMEVFPWVLGGLLIIVIVFLILFYIRKRKKAEPLFRIKPRTILKPREFALDEIEKLRIKRLWQNGKIKEYHSELTGIIRKYVEGQYSIMAMELTSDEILEALKDQPTMTGRPISLLKDILTLADLVKFAKAQPLPDVHEKSLEDARVFIMQTSEENKENDLPEINEGNSTLTDQKKVQDENIRIEN